MEFRKLRADEIDCRVATVSEKGCSILLYKDARADMNLLDETVGAENWQRNHEVINGNLFCNVGIKIDGEWVWKQDVGTESYTEAEKGQASDSFKRACFNWGLGRELYTAPFIWIDASNVKLTKKGDKYTTYDRFRVKDIDYTDGVITKLRIVDKNNKVVYAMGDFGQPVNKPNAKDKDKEEDLKLVELRTKIMGYLNRHEYTAEQIETICKKYGVTKPNDLSLEACQQYITFIKQKGGNIDE